MESEGEKVNNKITGNKFDIGDLVTIPPATDVSIIQAIRKIPGHTPTYRVLNLERTEKQHVAEEELTAVR